MKLKILAVLVAMILFAGCGSEKNFYTNGHFEVGKDIPAGVYVVVGKDGTLTVRSTADLNADNIIFGDFWTLGMLPRFYLELEDGEFVDVSGKKIYPVANAPKINSDEKISAGQYKVGVDIPAGEYKITPLQRDFVYFFVTKTPRAIEAISSNITPTSGDIVNAGRLSDTAQAVVLDGQYLTLFNCEAEFVRAVDAPEKILDLGMTLDEFKQKFHTSAVAGSVRELDAVQIQTGAVQDVFTQKFSPQLIIQGALDKSTGRVKEVWLIAQLQNFIVPEQAQKTFATMILASDPDLLIRDAADVAAELHLTENLSTLKKGNAETVRGRLRCTAILLQDDVVQLIVSPKDL